MISSLEINNYRNLKDFRIPSLGRVNLFTGKNNTGKSTLLEAIAIFAMKGDLPFLYELLAERGEKFKRVRENENINIVDSNIKTLSSLFANRTISFNEDNAISIGTENDKSNSGYDAVLIRFVKFIEETQTDKDGILSRKRVVVDKTEDSELSSYKIGFETRTKLGARLIALDEERFSRFVNRQLISEFDNLQFIRTRNIDREVNGKLWDNITLTEREVYVIDALKIIEPATERIAFIQDGGQDRSPVIKLVNSSGVIPLRSMGDGMNRILTIILALINSDNGYLLIDEFENGLHYTVQEKLWEIIFTISKILNVQVFVTTHSDDCIRGFENILNRKENKENSGKLVRLDNENGVIKQVEFTAAELKIATDLNIETR
ncbi:AAA family ATPase [Pedobacter sp. NJ-S-72]